MIWFLATRLVSSDGTVFHKDSTNAQCCVQKQSSISKLEDGTHPRWRWPLVARSVKLLGNGSFECRGGHRQSYQEWLDMAAQDDMGICVDGWRFSKAGILIWSNKFANARKWNINIYQQNIEWFLKCFFIRIT